jgi:hypothetical protein
VRIPRRLGAALSGAVIATMALSSVVLAADRVVVTPGSGGWGPDDNQAGSGQIRFTTDYGDPTGPGTGSVELSTAFGDVTGKAGLYNHSMFGTPIADVVTLGYWTFQPVTSPPNPAIAAASYQFQVDVNGPAPSGFTTFVFEPYQNPDQGAVTADVWQQWDVDDGLFWSTRINLDPAAATCITTADFGGPATYTLSDIQTRCPNAVVFGIGFNIGSNNPGWTVAVDEMEFNDTAWDFEVTNEPGDADECKGGGWMGLTDEEGNSFRNQGQCIKHAQGAGDGGDDDEGAE